MNIILTIQYKDTSVPLSLLLISTYNVWKYQRYNQKPNIEEGQTIQCRKQKGQMTNNDIQNTTHKTKDWATRIPLKTGVNSGAPEGSAVSTPLVVPVVLLLLRALWQFKYHDNLWSCSYDRYDDWTSNLINIFINSLMCKQSNRQPYCSKLTTLIYKPVTCNSTTW